MPNEVNFEILLQDIIKAGLTNSEQVNAAFDNVINLRNYYHSYRFCIEAAKKNKDPVKSGYNVFKAFKRFARTGTYFNSTNTPYHLKQPFHKFLLYNFQLIPRILIPERAGYITNPKTGENHAGDFSISLYGHFVKVIGSIIRLLRFFGDNNKNINNWLDVTINAAALVLTILIIISMFAIMPYSGLALSGIVAVTSLLRGFIGLGRSIYRLITSKDIGSTPAYAKEFVMSLLKIGLFVAFVALMAAGPQGLIAATALLVILTAPLIFEAFNNIHGLGKKWENFAEKHPYVAKGLSILAKPFILLSNLIKKPLLILDFLIDKTAKSIVFLKVKTEEKKILKKLKFDEKKIKIDKKANSYRYGLKADQQKQLNKIIRQGSINKLKIEIEIRCQKLRENNPDLFKAVDIENITQDSVTQIINNFKDLRTTFKGKNKTFKKEINKLIGFCLLYVKYSNERPNSITLQDFHDLQLQTGIYSHGDVFQNDDKPFLQDAHLSYAKNKAGFTKTVELLYDLFIDNCDVDTQFAPQLITLIDNKIKRLNANGKNSEESAKLKSLKKLKELIKRIAQEEPFLENLTAWKNEVETNIKNIQNEYFHTTFAFFKESETKQLFALAIKMVNKKVIEEENKPVKDEEPTQTSQAEPIKVFTTPPLPRRNSPTNWRSADAAKRKGGTPLASPHNNNNRSQSVHCGCFKGRFT